MKKLILLLVFITISNLHEAQKHVLPKLGYEYGAYEPFIDSQTMRVHHLKHHQGYVNKLNRALKGTKKEKESLNSILMNISMYNTAVRNNSGGHYNHSLFWEILNPKPNKQASEDLMRGISKSYESIGKLKEKMNLEAAKRFGSGWVWLILQANGELKITSTANQDNPLMDINKDRGIPIIAIDVWEHAYYLKYQNKRNDYLGAIWNLIDWGIVSDNYIKAFSSPIFQELKTQNWPELNIFRNDLSHIYYSAESENYEPLKTMTKELMMKAIYLKNSEIPKDLRSDEYGYHVILNKIEKQSIELHDLVLEHSSNKTLLKKLNTMHETFHQVQGVCKHHDEHYHEFKNK